MLLTIFVVLSAVAVGYMYSSTKESNSSKVNPKSERVSLVIKNSSDEFSIEGEITVPSSLDDDLSVSIRIANVGCNDIYGPFKIVLDCEGFHEASVTNPDALPIDSECQKEFNWKRNKSQRYIGEEIHITVADREVAQADYPLQTIAAGIVKTFKENTNVLLFGWRGSGKTCFLNHVLPLVTSYQPTLGVSRSSRDPVTLALQKHNFRDYFGSLLALTMFDTYGLTNTNYTSATFELIIQGLLDVTNRFYEYGFKEDQENIFSLSMPKKKQFLTTDVIDVVLVFIPIDATNEQIQRTSMFGQRAIRAKKKVIFVVTKPNETNNDDVSVISSKLPLESQVMCWMNASCFKAKLQLLQILIACINKHK